MGDEEFELNFGYSGRHWKVLNGGVASSNLCSCKGHLLAAVHRLYRREAKIAMGRSGGYCGILARSYGILEKGTSYRAERSELI